jgi:hypothetical protein
MAGQHSLEIQIRADAQFLNLASKDLVVEAYTKIK